MINRLSYQSLIRKIKPMDEKEERVKKEIIHWLGAEKSIYHTENPNKHLCAYFPLVDPEKKHVFLIHHKKSGLWLPTGGHLEKGETLKQTVTRELKEELGIEYQQQLVPFFISQITTLGKTAGHVHNDVWFLIKISRKTKLFPNKEEFLDWGWFGLDEAIKKSQEPNIERAIKKIRYLL